MTINVVDYNLDIGWWKVFPVLWLKVGIYNWISVFERSGFVNSMR